MRSANSDSETSKNAYEHQITLAEEFLEVYTVDQLMAETVEEYVTEISVRICGGDMDEL